MPVPQQFDLRLLARLLNTGLHLPEQDPDHVGLVSLREYANDLVNRHQAARQEVLDQRPPKRPGMVQVSKFADKPLVNPLHFLIKAHRERQTKYYPSGHMKIVTLPWSIFDQVGKMFGTSGDFNFTQADWRGPQGSPLFFQPDLTAEQYIKENKVLDPGHFFAERMLFMPKTLYNAGTGDASMNEGHVGIEGYPEELSQELLDPVALATVLLHEMRHHQQYSTGDPDRNANKDSSREAYIRFVESEREADLRAFQYLRSNGYTPEDVATVWRYVYLSPPFGNIANNAVKRTDYTRAYLDQLLDPSLSQEERDAILNAQKHQSTIHHHVGRTLDPSKQVQQIQRMLTQRGLPASQIKTSTSFTLPGLQQNAKLRAPLTVAPLPSLDFYRTFDPKYANVGKGAAYLWYTPVNTLQWVFDDVTDDAEKNAFLQFASLGSAIAPARAKQVDFSNTTVPEG